MSKEHYTPGPWRLWNGWSHQGRCHRVTRIGPAGGGGIETHTGDIKGKKADLMLIAAAPELLETCVALKLTVYSLHNLPIELQAVVFKAESAIRLAVDGE